jgi:outer membrane usher protein
LPLATLCLLLCPMAANAADQPMFLEVVVNGRATGQVGEFVQSDGDILARPQELGELGFVLPPALLHQSELIPLSSIPGLRARINLPRQTLMVVADDTLLQATEIGGGAAVRTGPLAPAGWGAVVNYDILATHAGSRTLGGAFFDTRMFGPYGTLSTTALGSFDPDAARQAPVSRLETLYTYAEPEATRRWRAGDVISSALGWSRSVRLGGGQVSTDFGLRPDLVTYPLPALGGSAALPSTVDVLVNGVQTLSQPVQAGPFNLRTLPIVTGAGDVLMTVTDALGRQTVVSLPFYATTALLQPGLASYSLEAGAVRQRFGLADSGYGDMAASGSLRYGLSETLTLEAHAEASDGPALGGLGGTLRVGTLGVVTAAFAGSSGGTADALALHGRGVDVDAGSGYLASFGFERRTPVFNLFLGGTVASPGYRDIAAINGTPVPRQTLRAGFGLQLGGYGSLSFGYAGQRGGRVPLSTRTAEFNPGLVGTADVSLATVSYSTRLGQRVHLYATGFKDLLREDSYGVAVGLSMSLGHGLSGSSTATLDDGRTGLRAQLQQSAQVPGDLGYRLYGQEGRSPRHIADAEYLLPWGRVAAGVDQSVGTTAGRAGLRGAIVAAGGGLFAANTINDSFAVVSSGDVPHVGVLYENRPVGRTDSGGRLLVPYLNSFQNNRLALQPNDLPPDVEVSRMRALVRPGDRVGVAVDFGVRASNPALLRLQSADGAPLPLGSRLRLLDGPQVPVGYDGEAFVTGLRPDNTAEAELPDGRRCRVSFPYRPTRGDLTVIGPLACL